jgi:hypothetical protein
VEQQHEPASSETIESDPEGLDDSCGSASLPVWLQWVAFIGIFLVALIAGIGRLLRLGQYPGGMTEAEAEHGLLARQIGDFGLQWAIENAGALSIPLVVVISWVGSLPGYDADTPRIASALFGAGSILFTGLWLNRAMGPIWGLASSAVLAGSFWHILFSRLGIGQIVGAFAIAALCWLLTEASVRKGSRATPWYVLAGLAAGIGFLATPSLRLLPLVILVPLVVSLIHLRRAQESLEARNWLLATAASYLTISPFLIANRSDVRLWTPWTATPGLPGQDMTDLSSIPGALIDSVTALAISSDSERGLNLPSDPWFSLLMLPWALIGILGLISASNDPSLRERFQVGVAVGIVAILGISAVDAGHPGQLLILSPGLAALAVYGFRTALRWARVRTVRYALAGLVVLGVAAETAVSIQHYEEWSRDPATRDAVHTDVTDVINRATALETDEPVFVTYSGSETVLDYFRTTARRHTYDGSLTFQFPADEDGYLIIAEPIPDPLVELLEYTGSVTAPLGDTGLAAYRLDDRLRREMPLSVPTVRYPNGPELQGASILSQQTDNVASFLIAWKSPPDSAEFVVESRLRPTDPARDATAASATLPANPLRGHLYQILIIEIDIPASDVASDLEIRLRRVDGSIVPVADMDQDGYLFLERYQAPDS